MAKLSKYAFLVQHHSYNSKTQIAELKSEKFHTKIIGVSTAIEATVIILDLIKEGIQLVELCGGFSKDDKDRIKKEINYKIPIGLVNHDEDDLKLLDLLQ